MVRLRKEYTATMIERRVRAKRRAAAEDKRLSVRRGDADAMVSNYVLRLELLQRTSYSTPWLSDFAGDKYLEVQPNIKCETMRQPSAKPSATKRLSSRAVLTCVGCCAQITGHLGN